MRKPDWKSSSTTESLRRQISEYAKKILADQIPRIPFEGYLTFREQGSRKESEAAYFHVRKQLTALGLYLQWHSPNEAERAYFNELLWSVANEFTWCLAAHLSYGEQGFIGEPHKEIDLFAAETAQTLSELLGLHGDIIDPYIKTYIISQIKERVLTPFLMRKWRWETSSSNWCAVCSGSIGMAALQLESGDRQKEVLSKVDQAMAYYLKGFGEDGATEEGIGYWVYGFGYYCYYLAMRLKLDPDYRLSEATASKMKQIAEFPGLVQIDTNSFLPFSDVSAKTLIPTGLATYLYEEFGAMPPRFSQITPFDFDHCYRFAHISRNLWWTDNDVFHKLSPDTSHYFDNRQWLVHRKGPCFFAIKGGHNQEEHNHNDVGSFILTLHGEQYLADLGAGPYTADYFGERRYEYVHTRSYYHNLPIISEQEQVPTPRHSRVEEVASNDKASLITMELSMLYELPMLQSLRRCVQANMEEGKIVLRDTITASAKLNFEEGFISRIKPNQLVDGRILFEGSHGNMLLHYDDTVMNYEIEEKVISNHLNEQETIYRLSFKYKEKTDRATVCFTFCITPLQNQVQIDEL